MKRHFLVSCTWLLLVPTCAQHTRQDALRSCMVASPGYPAEARQNGYAGKVVVKAITDTKGRVTEGSVVESSNFALPAGY